MPVRPVGAPVAGHPGDGRVLGIVGLQPPRVQVAVGGLVPLGPDRGEEMVVEVGLRGGDEHADLHVRVGILARHVVRVHPVADLASRRPLVQPVAAQHGIGFADLLLRGVHARFELDDAEHARRARLRIPGPGERFGEAHGHVVGRDRRPRLRRRRRRVRVVRAAGRIRHARHGRHGGVGRTRGRAHGHHGEREQQDKHRRAGGEQEGQETFHTCRTMRPGRIQDRTVDH